MPDYGLSVYNAGREQLYTRQLLNLYYSINIIKPKAGTVSFTLPTVPVGSGVTGFIIAPTRQPFDKVLDMGGTNDGTPGWIQGWAFKNITISGRVVSIEIIKSAGGYSDLALTFYTDGG